MVIATSATMIHIYLPFFINWIGIVALIFGGCCSNVSYSHQYLARPGSNMTQVFALESIIK